MSESKVMLGNIECRPIEESDEFNGRTYEQGRADKEKELQGLKDLGALYSEIRTDERAKVIDEIETKLYEYGFIWTEHAEKVWKDIREQIMEQSNE